MIHSTKSGIEYVRTPENRFARLPEFPYHPSYIQIDGLRMAYIDVGEGASGTFLLLHGEPAWSYLYRRMIPSLVKEGFRCIAPDLIGFGRSDKPVSTTAYTYQNHLAWLTAFVTTVDLQDTSLFVQDWGGLLGLRLFCDEADRFDRIAIGNTALPIGESLGEGFDAWLAFSQSSSFDDVGSLFERSVKTRTLSPDEIDGYRAPFPSDLYLSGVKAFPTLVPITPDHKQVAENRQAWEILSKTEKPIATFWGQADVVFGADEHRDRFVTGIPGAEKGPHELFPEGGHFIQDDCGEEIAAHLVAWEKPR